MTAAELAHRLVDLRAAIGGEFLVFRSLQVDEIEGPGGLTRAERVDLYALLSELERDACRARDIALAAAARGSS